MSPHQDHQGPASSHRPPPNPSPLQEEAGGGSAPRSRVLVPALPQCAKDSILDPHSPTCLRGLQGVEGKDMLVWSSSVQPSTH